MASRSKPYTGLDIDPLGITAAQVEMTPAGLVVQRCGYQALEPGVVREGEVADASALSEALRALYAQTPNLARRVRVGVANQKVVVRTLELPALDDPKELAAAVAFQAQDLIPMPLDQAVLDWAVLDVVETDQGRRQQVLLAAARRDMIASVVEATDAAGLVLEGIDVGAFGLVRALGAAAGDDEVVLYAGVMGITNVAIARAGQCLFSRASGTGIEHVAVSLAERSGLTIEHAHAWLVHVGLERPLAEIEGEADIVMEARRVLEDAVRRIAGELRQSVEFHQMQSTGLPIGRLVLAGRAAAIPGFASALGAEMGLPAEPASVVGDLAGPLAFDAVVAAGLAAPGMPRVNLIPQDRRRSGLGGRSNGAAYAVVGALALAVLLALVGVLAGNRVTSRENELAAVTARAVQAEQRAQALTPYADFSALRATREQTVRGLATTRFDWSHALDEITRTLPAGVHLTSMTGSVSSGAASGGSGLRAAISTPAIEMTGCTTSQTAVADVLSDLRRMDAVTRVALAASDKADAGSSTGSGGGSSGPCASSSTRPNFSIVVFFAPPTAGGAS